MIVTFTRSATIAGTTYAGGDTANLNGDALVQALLGNVAVISGAGDFWDDLRFPAQAVNPPGAVSDPTWDATHVGWSFAGNADNTIQIVGQMPHAWALESPIKPHLHIKTTGTASAKKSLWRLQYRIANPVSTGPSDWQTIDINEDSPADSGVYRIYSFGEIPMNTYRVSAVMDFIITRLATDDLDTDTNAIVLKEFDMHYQQDGIGSGEELVK